MIKNTLALSCILFASYLSSSQLPTITIPDLSAVSLEKALSFAKEQGGSPFRIEVIPQQSFLTSFTSYFSSKAQLIRNYFTLTSLAKKVAVTALSLGWISYLLCAYVIYKAFTLLQTVTAWVSWCTDDELLLASDEQMYRTLEMQLYRHHQKRGMIPDDLPSLINQLQEEERILTQYFALDTWLCRYKIRDFFPYASKHDRYCIEKAYQKLIVAKTLLHHRNFRAAPKPKE